MIGTERTEARIRRGALIELINRQHRILDRSDGWECNRGMEGTKVTHSHIQKKSRVLPLFDGRNLDATIQLDISERVRALVLTG